MLQENLIRMYEESFRAHRELPALTDYFKGETFSYYEMAKEIAKLHLFFKKAEIRRGDKIALVGRNNPRWCWKKYQRLYLCTLRKSKVLLAYWPNVHNRPRYSANLIQIRSLLLIGNRQIWFSFLHHKYDHLRPLAPE